MALGSPVRGAFPHMNCLSQLTSFLCQKKFTWLLQQGKEDFLAQQQPSQWETTTVQTVSNHQHPKFRSKQPPNFLLFLYKVRFFSVVLQTLPVVCLRVLNCHSSAIPEETHFTGKKNLLFYLSSSCYLVLRSGIWRRWTPAEGTSLRAVCDTHSSPWCSLLLWLLFFLSVG